MRYTLVHGFFFFRLFLMGGKELAWGWAYAKPLCEMM